MTTEPQGPPDSAVLDPRIEPLSQRTIFDITVSLDAGQGRAPIRASDVAAALKERGVVAVVQDGAIHGAPRVAFIRAATDDNGHVVTTDAAGTVRPGQSIQDFLPGLAYRLQSPFVVDDDVLVRPHGDGDRIVPVDRRVGDEIEAAFGQKVSGLTWLWWADHDVSAAMARIMATTWKVPVSTATVGGTCYAIPDQSAGSVDWETFGADARPAGYLRRYGSGVELTVQAVGDKAPISLSFVDPMTPVDDYLPGSEAHRLAVALQLAYVFLDPRSRGTAIPADVYDACFAAAVHSLDWSVEDRVAPVLAAAGVPSAVLTAFRDEDSDLASVLVKAGLRGDVEVIEPQSTVRKAALRGWMDALLDEPTVTNGGSRFSRFLWRHPVVMLGYAVVVLAIGVAYAYVILWVSDPQSRWGGTWLRWLSWLAVAGCVLAAVRYAVLAVRRLRGYR